MELWTRILSEHLVKIESKTRAHKIKRSSATYIKFVDHVRVDSINEPPASVTMFQRGKFISCYVGTHSLPYRHLIFEMSIFHIVWGVCMHILYYICKHMGYLVQETAISETSKTNTQR